MYYTYMLRCENNSIYTGITTDVKRRIKALTKVQKESLIKNHALEKYLAEKIECDRYKIVKNIDKMAT